MYVCICQEAIKDPGRDLNFLTCTPGKKLGAIPNIIEDVGVLAEIMTKELNR